MWLKTAKCFRVSICLGSTTASLGSAGVAWWTRSHVLRRSLHTAAPLGEHRPFTFFQSNVMFLGNHNSVCHVPIMISHKHLCVYLYLHVLICYWLLLFRFQCGCTYYLWPWWEGKESSSSSWFQISKCQMPGPHSSVKKERLPPVWPNCGHLGRVCPLLILSTVPTDRKPQIHRFQQASIVMEWTSMFRFRLQAFEWAIDHFGPLLPRWD